VHASLGATVIEVRWVINAYTLMLAALILPGALGDRLGRVRVFASGGAIFALASLWCGLAPTIGHLIAARTLQGLGGELLIPGCLALISASFPTDDRGRAIGLWSGFSALTGAAGPLRHAVVALDLSCQRSRGARDPGDRRHASAGESGPAGAPPRLPGALLITASLTGVTYGLLESPARSLGDPAVLAAVLLGTCLLGAFVVVQARAQAPIVPLDLFRSPTFTGANLLTLFSLRRAGRYAVLPAAQSRPDTGLLRDRGGAALLPFVLIGFACRAGRAGWSSVTA
jgi:MFS family permease